MNAPVGQKAKLNLSFFLFCRELTTGVSTHNGCTKDGCDFKCALVRCHLLWGIEFDWFHGLQWAFGTPTNHESNLPKQWVT
jgi:hypothetical protein